ncbi:MAG: peptidylprolyl isomerase [Clostridia bacterium]|nr:peptidylprolyl isomerase [Clostridia bacterium]
MKRLTALIIAGVLVTTSILGGCGKKNVDKNNLTPNMPDNSSVEEHVTPNRIGSPEELVSNLEFNAEFEAKLAEVIEKKDLDNEILINISGVPVSAAFVRYAVLACNQSYQGSTEENIEQIKAQEIDSYFRVNSYLVNKAIEMGLTVSEDEFTENFTDMYAQFKQYYGDDVDSVIEMYTYQTPYAYFLTSFYNLLYSKIYEERISDEEFAASVREATLTDMLESETEYVRAKHILICFPEEGEGENGEVTEEQKLETLNRAREVLALVESGEDFDALVKEHGEDPGMESYPGGYYFTTGKMVEQFEETAFALKEGDISGLVETNYGYHIIQRLPLDDDAILATDEYMSKSYEMFAEELDTLSKDYEFVYSENYESRYADFLAEYEEMANPTVEEETTMEETFTVDYDQENQAEVEAENEADAEVQAE